MNKSPVKGEARLAVEEALKTATPARPMDVAAVARITGLPEALARTHVHNCVNTHLAHNVNPPGQPGAAYAWGMRPDAYTGEKPSPVRNGAMDAFSLPSRHGDTAVERKRPICIGMRPEVRP